MKKKFILFILLLITTLSVLITELNAYQVMAETELNKIVITGSSCTQVTPDSAKISAEIQTLDLDRIKSKNDNYELFEKLLDALAELGVTKDDITLDYFSTYESYDYNNGKTLLGYYTTNDFSFNIDNLDNIKNYVDILIENKATIKNINYSIKDVDSVYNETLLKAIENAKTKANMLGDLKLVEIKEENTYNSPTLYKAFFNEETNIIGKINISSKVTAIFEKQN